MTSLNLTPKTERVPYLNVSEHFGPTIQGEGRAAGQLASFFRLAGCNLTCSWCDSPYTWDWTRFNHSEEVHQTTVEAAVTALEALPGRIIITGGEPLLQATTLGAVLNHPRLAGRLFDLETNGTRPLGDTAPAWANISCSPKIIPSADQGPIARRLNVELMEDPRTDFKFVVHDQNDLDALDTLITEEPAIAAAAQEGRVWLMPEGTTPEALTNRTPFVINAAVERGFNFSSRIHVYGWHDVRGH